MPHSDGWQLAQERMIRERLSSLSSALSWGTKAQIKWNLLNLRKLIEEYLK